LCDPPIDIAELLFQVLEEVEREFVHRNELAREAEDGTRGDVLEDSEAVSEEVSRIGG
jgi:hypothetical protein